MNQVGYVDHLLRNREQVTSDLHDELKVGHNTAACFRVFVILSAVYGFIMGSYNLIHGYKDGLLYALASAVKIPLLFLMTLAICLPLLYVLNVLIGPRARFKVVLGMLMASIAVSSIVLASCALIVGFFMLSTKSYEFILILNVAVFSMAGAYGVWFLGKGMHDLVPASVEAESPKQSQQSISTIMKWWLITYGIVGTQMAWIMRPFIGSPSLPFAFFRSQESNFYISVAHTITRLLGW